jgi:Sulfotransferase domain
MNRWPDFFIVGTPRAGTTSLYYYLNGHPNIFMPSVKEPHFFNQFNYAAHEARCRPLPVGMIKSVQDYLSLFRGATPDVVVGEASTSYLASEIAPQRIKEANPHAKIVVVLREPVDRAYSFYLLSVREGWERNSSFYGALREDYEYMEQYPGEGSSVYVWSGLYYQHLQRYLNTFGKEYVRVYLYEDLATDTKFVVRDLCSFLEVPFYDGSFFDPDQKYHTYGAPRNALLKWVGQSRTVRSLAAAVAPMPLLIPLRDRLVNREEPKPPLDLQGREFLRSIYYDDILKLQDLIGRDLSSWLA